MEKIVKLSIQYRVEVMSYVQNVFEIFNSESIPENVNCANNGHFEGS